MKDALRTFVTAGWALSETWVQEAIDPEVYRAVFKVEFEEALTRLQGLVRDPTGVVEFYVAEPLLIGDRVFVDPENGRLTRCHDELSPFQFVMRESVPAGGVARVPVAW